MKFGMEKNMNLKNPKIIVISKSSTVNTQQIRQPNQQLNMDEIKVQGICDFEYVVT